MLPARTRLRSSRPPLPLRLRPRGELASSPLPSSEDETESITDEVGYVFVAEELTPGEQSLDETEALEVEMLPFAEACRWALDGRITDAISVAGLLKLAA